MSEYYENNREIFENRAQYEKGRSITRHTIKELERNNVDDDTIGNWCYDRITYHIRDFCMIPKKYQTDKLCWYAIKSNPHSIKYVTNQTNSMCWYVIQKNAWTLAHIRNQTKFMCWYVIVKYPLALCTIKNPEPEMKNYAIYVDPKAENVKYDGIYVTF